MIRLLSQTPLELGYRFPAEWEKHRATWLGYPFQETSWPGRINEIIPVFCRFATIISQGEMVCMNVQSEEIRKEAQVNLQKAGAVMENITFFHFPSNDSWFRDFGPAFLVNPDAEEKKIAVNWGYNAWGNKYPCELDDQMPLRIAQFLGIPAANPGIVMEGGSVDSNGRGSLLTTTSCLLHENRNPLLSQAEIETFLCDFYGVQQVIWLKDGIEGDDTNGHIDDITRFVSVDTVITMIESNPADPNHQPLAENLEILNNIVLPDGKKLQVMEIPMPDPQHYDGQRLPASYANFYICNHAIIVPTFGCPQDEQALEILKPFFSDRQVIGLDSSALIWGLGSFHCMSQQEPE
ncbi:MAG: agmatine deiminase family protein [Bacteroidetes bacterium]|nr:agmatine deiminase family protein [Bacteroidota bacterium]